METDWEVIARFWFLMEHLLLLMDHLLPHIGPSQEESIVSILKPK